MNFNLAEVSIYIQDNHIGDYSSIIALLITLVGFGVTIYQLSKTKKASEVATAAVNNIRNDLKKVDTVTNLSSVLTEMAEIKRLHRENNYSQLPDKYSKLRASLITIKASNSILIEQDLKTLQGAIAQLKASEKVIDLAFEKNENSEDNMPSISKLNGLISNHIDKLQEVLIRVKYKIGEN